MGSKFDKPPPAKIAPPKCGAVKNGRRCKQPAGYGTEHVGYGQCKLHAGNTPSGRLKGAVLEMQDNHLVMGLPVDVDPLEAILTCIRITAGEIVYCNDRLKELKPRQAIVKHKKVVSRAGDLDSYEEVEKSNDSTLNIWIVARQQAMDRLVRYSKTAIDCGIAERQVRVAEETGQTIGRLLHTVLAELGLTEKQKQLAPEVIHRNLVLLEARSADIAE